MGIVAADICPRSGEHCQYLASMIEWPSTGRRVLQDDDPSVAYVRDTLEKLCEDGNALATLAEAVTVCGLASMEGQQEETK